MCSFSFVFVVCPCSVPVLLPSPLLLHSLLSHAFLLYSVLPFSPSFILTWCGHAVVVASLKVKRNGRAKRESRRRTQTAIRKTRKAQRDIRTCWNSENQIKCESTRHCKALSKKPDNPKKMAYKPQSQGAEKQRHSEATSRHGRNTATVECLPPGTGAFPQKLLPPRSLARSRRTSAFVSYKVLLRFNFREQDEVQFCERCTLPRKKMLPGYDLYGSMFDCWRIPLQLYVAKFQLIQPLGCMFNLTILRMLRLN